MPADPGIVADTFARVHRTPEHPFDFSLASLKRDVDWILALHGVSRVDATLQEQLEQVETGLAAYVGESLCRLFDGRWEGQFRDDNPGPNFYLSWVAFGTYRFFPSHFVGYRIANGSAERTFADHLASVLPAILLRTGVDRQTNDA